MPRDEAQKPSEEALQRFREAICPWIHSDEPCKLCGYMPKKDDEKKKEGE